ncbi:helix-turn-helix domain-containing protein [Streptomyces sp. NPDC056149]|uniref:helix-turn-helix domain-containing protein n=1 Tax=Streptomyces sp. NPDC056149 TaxID=3345728 RepID=UPI0035D84193
MLDNGPDVASDKSGKVVRRVVDVLRALERLQGELGRPVYLREVAAETGLASATACRYLQSLEKTGIVGRPSDGPRGTYWLDRPPTPMDRRPAVPSPWVRARLVRLGSRTGQIALLYAPYHLGETPQRICTDQVWGVHDPLHEALDPAPLGADGPGLVIAAALHDRLAGDPRAGELRRVRELGYAVGPAAFGGDRYDTIAAPVWRGPAVAGAVALMPLRTQMRSPRERARFVSAVMETAGAMSNHLTRRALTRVA